MVEAEAIPLSVVLKTRPRLVINKARGMVVHPARGRDPERWSTPCWHMRMTFQELAGI